MTERDRQGKNGKNQKAQKHSDSFITLVELVRHMARCAAQQDYDSMLEAARENENLITEWKNKS